MGDYSDEAHADCLELIGELPSSNPYDTRTYDHYDHPSYLPSSSAYLRQQSEARITYLLQNIRVEAKADEAEAEAKARSRSRSKSPISKLLHTHADLKYRDFQQPCVWRAAWDFEYEAHLSLVRSEGPLVFEWDDATCWGRGGIGTWHDCLRHVQMQVVSIKSVAIQDAYYIGLSRWPLCRFLGKSVFPWYALDGHIDKGWGHCRVVAAGDAKMIKCLEMAGIGLNPTGANRSKGGEHAGADGELSFLYVLWCVDVLAST